MSNLNLQVERTWLQDERILCYTVYSLNNSIMKEWAQDILGHIKTWSLDGNPLLLFDLSNPNVSMSYFVLTRRDIFNIGMTPETRVALDHFADANPELRIRLAVILSKTMVGVVTGKRGTSILRQLIMGKVFFDKDAATTWLLAASDYAPDAHTRHMEADDALNEMELDTLKSNVYHAANELRLLVNGSLEIVPISEARPLIIGRSRHADLDVSSHGQPATTVSRQHAQLSMTNGELSILDLGSKNGTFIGDQRLESGKARRITSTDEIMVGAISIRLLS